MKKTKLVALPLMGAAALSLGGCAENYAAEGAGIGAALGAGVAAITGEDLVTYAAAGAAAGGIAGYFKDKNDECDGYYNRDGRYVDDDCRNDERFRDFF
jgi:osmotically inducible lipoprotein OsmB